MLRKKRHKDCKNSMEVTLGNPERKERIKDSTPAEVKENSKIVHEDGADEATTKNSMKVTPSNPQLEEASSESAPAKLEQTGTVASTCTSKV